MKTAENFIKFILSIARLVIGLRFSNSPDKILKNSKKTKQVLILGNGPSFNQTEEKFGHLFSQFDLIAVNRFPETKAYEQYKPSFLVLLAPQFFMEESELSEEYITANQLLFTALQTKTSWPLLIIVAANQRKSERLKHLLKSNKHITAYYIKVSPVEGFTWFTHLGFTFRQGMPRPHNVLIPSLMTAIQAKFETIAIIGADHSWLSEISVNKQNEALVHQKHFYDQDSSSPKQMQDYIVRPRMLHEILHKFYLSFKGYWDIKAYAQKKGVTIYNCSETSMIDAFERSTLDKLINTPIQKK